MARATNPATPTARNGGQILVANLLAQGVDLAFCVPGESYLAVLDALYDAREQIRLLVCRQEGGAAAMAEAHGKLTGRPGICFVTRGPGASNAAIGLHTAAQDSTPMILFVGQVGGDFAEREAFQEIDYRQMYGSVVKWVAQIDRAERIPEYVARAFRVAMSGRPGPVVIALPEDMLTTVVVTDDVPRVEAAVAWPEPAAVTALEGELSTAQSPLLLLGGSGWSADACRDIALFAEAYSLPVACGFRSQDLFDNSHAQYAGDVGIAINPKLAARVRDADLLIVVGERLGEMTTGGYSLIRPPLPGPRLVHVHPGAEELGSVYQPALAIQASMPAFAAVVAKSRPAAQPPWTQKTIDAHADYLAWQQPRPMAGELDMWKVLASLREHLPADAILTNGAGNYTVWLHRLYRYRPYRTQLAPYSGAMGYSVPAAVAAKAAQPERTVVCWSGDGCFQMNGQELATAIQYDLAIVFIIVDNGMYGTIRMHQERHYPARVHGTDLRNPDFAALAHAYGAHGEAVTRTEEFGPALDRALAAGRAAVLWLRLDPQALTMNASLDEIRAQSLRAQASG